METHFGLQSSFLFRLNASVILFLSKPPGLRNLCLISNRLKSNFENIPTNSFTDTTEI